MSSRSWALRRPRTAVTVAAVTALMIGAAGWAVAASESASSSATSSVAPGITKVASVTPLAPLAGFADIVDAVRPAVVNIEVVRGPGGRHETDGTEEHGERHEHHRGEGHERHHRSFRAAGSGFLIDAGGTIVTNNHVVAGAERIDVSLSDGRSFEAALVGRDPATDLAVIEIDAGEDLPFVAFGDSKAARVGDWVLTVGNPFGLENSVTMGIISASGRSIGAGRYDDFLQIDAPINRGNSGGPAFNTRGEVIGVNTAIFSPSGGSVGIGFAIPSAMVEEIVAELQTDGRVERGWLGVRIQAVTEDLAEGLDLDQARGALVAEVTEDSPAEAAGLAAGDVVLSVNGESIKGVRDLTRTIARLDPGADAELGLWRQGEAASVTIALGSFPEPERMARAETGKAVPGQAVMGMRLAKLDEEAREAFDIEEETEGVLIAAVKSGSPAARKGLRRGDVILQAGQRPVSRPAEVAAVIDAARQENRKAVLVLISREEGERFITLPLRDA